MLMIIKQFHMKSFVLPRVLNDLRRTRLARLRMMWPSPHSPPSSPVSKLEKERQLADGRRKGVGEEPNHTTARKPVPL